MKKFKLPKEFALKWLEALRSGKYQQGTGELVILLDSTVYDVETTKFCCLGVASHVCGHSVEQLEYCLFVAPHLVNVPTEISGVPNKNELVAVLSALNDKVRVKEFSTALFKDCIFREYKIDDDDMVKFDFNQIADFIEDNCEFYETEIVNN